MKYYIIPLFLIICATLSSCYKDTVDASGEIIISFHPVVNNDVDSTRYWYLYTKEPGLQTPFLRKGYLGSSDENGRVTINLESLNVGNYVFRYYVNRDIKDNAVQVTGGKRKKYNF